MKPQVFTLATRSPQVANDLCGLGDGTQQPTTDWVASTDQFLRSEGVQSLIAQGLNIYQTRIDRKRLESEAGRQEQLAILREELARQQEATARASGFQQPTQNQWLMPALIGGGALVLLMVLK